MKLLDMINAAGGRCSGGDPYCWDCFGQNANYMEFRDVDGNGCSHCVFDTKTYQVYQVHVEVPLISNEAESPVQAFQWIDPEFNQGHTDESNRRGVDPNVAWDDVKYINIDDEATILQYVKDIGETYYDDLPIQETVQIKESTQ